MAFTCSDALTFLSNLYGEESADTSASRIRLLDQIGRDIWYRRPWSFRRATSSLSVSSGTVSLPADFALDGFEDARQVASGTGNDKIYKLINQAYKDNYSSSDYVCWITGDESSGYTFNSHDTSATVELNYWKKWTTLSTTSDVVYFPSLMALCFGALELVRTFNDPEYEVSFNNFEREIMKMAAQDLRNTELPLISPHEAFGTAIGEPPR